MARTSSTVIVQHASLPHQRHALCTLSCLHQTIAAEGLGSPSVIIVGQVLSAVMGQVHALSTLPAYSNASA
jgi:uroporphyrin-III C-methyltransferase